MANSTGPRPVRISVVPHNPLMFGQGASQRLLVIAHYADGSTADVTSSALLEAEAPKVASLENGSLVRARSNGGATIRASYSGLTTQTTALVQQAEAPLSPSFAADILPVLTKYGCNGGNCHGALNGQNGFKLSLFGYEPDKD